MNAHPILFVVVVTAFATTACSSGSAEGTGTATDLAGVTASPQSASASPSA